MAASTAANSTRNASARLVRYGVKVLNPDQGPQTLTWRYDESNGASQHRITATWTREDVYPPYIDLSLNDGPTAEHAKLTIPDNTLLWNVNIIENNCLLHLQKTLRNGQPIEVYILYFDSSQTHRTRSINILNAIKGIVRQLPYNKVPYFNLGGRLPPPLQRSSTALASYNLRQPAAPAPDSEHKPWALVYAASQSTIEFQNRMAQVFVRQFLVRVTGGRFAADRDLVLPPVDSNVPARMIEERAAPADNDADEEEEEEESAPMSTPTKCGGCGEDESPMGMGSIKNRLSRKKWVGCQNAENCRSRNFWFHFKCCDAEWNRVGNKTHRWFCPACRGDIPGRVVDGKYMRVQRQQ